MKTQLTAETHNIEPMTNRTTKTFVDRNNSSIDYDYKFNDVNDDYNVKTATPTTKKLTRLSALFTSANGNDFNENDNDVKDDTNDVNDDKNVQIDENNVDSDDSNIDYNYTNNDNNANLHYHICKRQK